MKNKGLILFLLLLVLYFVLHLFKLNSLPVFADESIYIRWSQLIIDDFARYLFYPMNDGKTPLLMWLTTPFLKIFNDQLYAARLVSVLIGSLSVLSIFLILRQLKFKKAAYFGMFLVIISPFTFFYHRLALTDALLLLNLSLTYFFVLKINQKKQFWPILGAALFFFLAILSKTPALLFMPVFYLSIFFEDKISLKLLWQKGLRISLALLLAGLAFYGLRVIPLFTQLFAVGGNFLQDRSTLLSAEIWQVILRNSSFFSAQLLQYLGPVVLILALPLFRQSRKQQTVLFLSALLFLAPLILLGKIVYPRYILPSSLFFLSSAAISLQNLGKHKLLQALAIFLIILPSSNFLYKAYFNVDQLPLSKADREQFLEEWSSGHGIKEVVDLIKELAKEQKVAVATEGYFGTLPDGILLNLHNQNVENIYVEGIGQPVRNIPESFWLKAHEFDRQLLIVNSHRLQLQLPQSQLLVSFCRPNQAPCLEVWEIKEENFK